MTHIALSCGKGYKVRSLLRQENRIMVCISTHIVTQSLSTPSTQPLLWDTPTGMRAGPHLWPSTRSFLKADCSRASSSSSVRPAAMEEGGATEEEGREGGATQLETHTDTNTHSHQNKDTHIQRISTRANTLAVFKFRVRIPWSA